MRKVHSLSVIVTIIAGLLFGFQSTLSWSAEVILVLDPSGPIEVGAKRFSLKEPQVREPGARYGALPDAPDGTPRVFEYDVARTAQWDAQELTFANQPSPPTDAEIIDQTWQDNPLIRTLILREARGRGKTAQQILDELKAELP